MAAGGYIRRREQEELLRGAAAAGLSAEDQANLAAGSDSLAVQQQAQDSSADAVVAGAAGAAAFLAHSTRAVLRDAARRDGIGKIVITRHYAWNGGEGERPFDKTKVHQAGLLMVIEGLGSPWGGNPKILDVVKYEHTYTGTVSHVQFRMHADVMLLSNTLVYGGRLRCCTPRVAAETLRVPRLLSLIHI